MTKLKRILRLCCCRVGYHFRGQWNKEGITCEDCGFHKPKCEVIASLNAGGGW